MIFSAFERMMAWRYLRARKQEGSVSIIAIFSFIGILLGVATLIIVLSVMNGFRIELFDRLIGMNGHMVIYSKHSPIQDYNKISLKAREIKGITKFIPLIETQALAQAGGVSTGAVIRGLHKQDFVTKPVLGNSLVSKDPKNYFGADTIAIGIEMAKRLDVGIGNEITLISPRGKSTPFGVMPRSRSYEITAIFDVGMFEYNNNFIYMPMETAQNFLSIPGRVSSIQIFTTSPDDLTKLKNNLQKALADHNLGIYSWRDINGSFSNALEVERNVMFLILTLIILVAAFNIISSMIMLVKDKTHDIAILRTMGASRYSMLNIFILTGASIGFLGTIAGALIGISFASNIESIRQLLQNLSGTELFPGEIYFLSHLPAEIDWSEISMVVLMAFGLSFLATLYPAWRAARLDPVEALRYE